MPDSINANHFLQATEEEYI